MIRVLLADDHVIVREGLRALLRFYDDVEVVGEASDGAEAVALVGELRPDIVLMDIAMPGMNGLAATRLIREQYPETQVLILSQHEDREYVSSALKSGAAGYILKRAARADLIAALHALARGEVFLHPSASAAMVQEIRGSVVSLTPRERDILQHIVRGQTSAEIAATLCLSPNTVEWHRTNIMTKVGVHNVAALIRYAYQHRLVETED